MEVVENTKTTVEKAKTAGKEIFECSASTLKKSFGNSLSVVSSGAGSAMNFVSQDLFQALVGGTNATKADIIKLKKELKKELNRIQMQITRLSHQIESGIALISDEIIKSTYNIGSMQLDVYVNKIINLYTDLNAEYQKDPDTMTPQQLSRSQNTIGDILKEVGDDIVPNFGQIYLMLLGDNPADPDSTRLLKLYADKLRANKRFASRENYQDSVKQFLLYYNHIEALELLLSLEFLRYSNQSQSRIDRHSNTLKSNSKAELDWFNSASTIPDDIYIFKNSNFYLMLYLPKNQRSDMKWEASDIFNKNSGLTGTFTSCLRYVFSMDRCKTSSVGAYIDTGIENYDFINWVLPSQPQIEDMFRGWEKAGKPTILGIQQGLNLTPGDLYFPIASPINEKDGGTVAMCLSNNFSMADPDYYYYRTGDGTIGKFLVSANNGVNLLPVREVKSDEKYVW